MNNLRFAIRQLLKHPGFTAVAALTLALGIGANTTVYSWIRGTLIETLPAVKDQGRLVVICPRHRAGNVWDTCSYPDVLEFRRMTNIFSGIVGSQVGLANVRVENAVFWTWAQPISAEAFSVLGLAPALGRGFLPEEQTKPGGHPVAIISHALWRTRFGGRPDVIGRPVEINRRPFTIVGVAPAGFQGTMGGLRLDLWVPLMMHGALGLGSDNLEERSSRWIHTMARLQPGTTMAEAQAALNVRARQWETAYPDSNRQLGFELFPLWKAPYGGQARLRPLLQALAAMSIVVLLIVLANLASLQLVRASARSKEIAVRVALGANGRHLLKQLLTESVLLAGLGGLGGVLLAAWGMDSLQRFLPKTYLAFGYAFHLDAAVLGVAALLVLVTALALGLAPAWQATRSSQFEDLKEGSRTSEGAPVRSRVRSGLVVAEVALALLLLICGGLALKSFHFAQRVRVGLDPRHVLLAGLRLESDGYDSTTGPVFVRKLMERAAAVPGVEAAAAGDWLPLGFEGGSSSRLEVNGYQETPGEYMNVGTSVVTADYCKTFRIPVLAGREFRASDDSSAPRVAMINEEVARRFFAGRSPLGATVRFWGNAWTVVGVVKNGKYRSLSEPQQPFVYAPWAQHYEPHLGMAVRVAGDPYSYVSHLRAAVKEVDPAVEPFTLLSMEDYMGAAYLLLRVASTLLVTVSLVALFLSALGIYGVTAYAVSRRTREIGIRMALGASGPDIYRLVLGGGLRMAATGLGIGLLLSLGITRLMAGVLVGVTPTDPVTFLLVTALLLAAALLACFLPARRAARVEPMEALRCE